LAISFFNYVKTRFTAEITSKVIASANSNDKIAGATYFAIRAKNKKGT
jgi:hypothetical protein